MLCRRCDQMAERNARLTVLAVSLAKQLHTLLHQPGVQWFRCPENACRRTALLTGRATAPHAVDEMAAPGRLPADH